MNIKLATNCFVIGALLAPVAVIAEENRDTAQTHPMTYIDSIITSKTQASLTSEKMDDLVQIGVDTTTRARWF